MSLQEFCRKPVIKISADANITEACRLMEQNNVGCLLAEQNGRLCGVLTDRDIALRVAGPARDPWKTTVAEIMTPDPVRISVDKDVRHVISLMHEYHVRRVVIVNDHDAAVGVVSMDDLIAILGDEMSDIANALRQGGFNLLGGQQTGAETKTKAA